MKLPLTVLCCFLAILSDILTVSVTSSALVRSRNLRSNNVCPAIQLKNGIVKRRAKGRVVRFFCIQGFLLAGEKHSTCTRGKWDPAPPRCVRPTCKPIGQQSENLLIYPTHQQAVQHFFCKAGYILKGPRDIFCNGTKWSDNAPTCIGVSEKPKLSCDFESTDLCGWTHDLNHDFDWIRQNFLTPSGEIGTGPSFDHTKGRGKDGYYMYIESSSRVENDTARLISPVYDGVDDGEEVCFEFYYHMFGATIGTLRAYMKTINETWDLNPKSAFFSKSGNQGNRWYRSFHRFTSINDEFQIIIEGVRGNGYVSDIAIDDVRIIPDCQLDEESTTTVDSSTYNEVVPTVDTCDNRCGQTEPKSSGYYHLTCDCDDNCFTNNRCCPDYYDTCSTETTTQLDSTTTEEPTAEKFVPTAHSVGINRRATAAPPTKKITPLPIVTSTRIMPAIYFKTPPITPLIFRKTTTRKPPTTTTTKTFTTSKAKPPQKPPTVAVTNAKPPTRSKPVVITRVITTTIVYHETERNTIDDAIDVPRPTNNDEGLYDMSSGSKEYWSDEIENSIDTPYIRNFNESNKLLSQVRVEEANSHVIIITIGVCATVTLIAVITVMAVRTCRYTRRPMRSSHGESQSDVRFLTSSDVLDFTVANSHEELVRF